MSTTGCAAVRPNLGALVDGELRGATVLRVLRHVDACRACADEVEALRRLGDLVRVSVSVDTPGALDGLASTIVSRSRAEAEQSWRGVLRRASEDWHWVFVGAGSVAATFVIAIALSAVLAFGPKPQRDDSLRGLISSLDASPGCLFIAATPAGTEPGDYAWLMQVQNDCPTASRALASLALRSEDVSPSDADIVDALARAIPHGNLRALHPNERKFVTGLLEAIERRQLNDFAPQVSPELQVHDVRLVTSTNVSARGL